jgi:hypothetical protein
VKYMLTSIYVLVNNNLKITLAQDACSAHLSLVIDNYL